MYVLVDYWLVGCGLDISHRFIAVSEELAASYL
jgi:hypothetical protein